MDTTPSVVEATSNHTRNHTPRLSPDESRARYERLSVALKEGKPIMAALLAAGWPERQARKGWKVVPRGAWEYLIERDTRLEQIGKQLLKDPSKLEARVIGEMYEAMMDRNSDGVPAAKLLAAHKSISPAFVQDAAQNVVVIQAPNQPYPEPVKTVENVQPVKDQLLPDYE
jgi:hypothetical protein